MDNKEFGKKLEERTMKFAISIIKLSALIPYDSESKIIKNQITKSGTSICANYREANRSRSRRDFANKIRICEGEASETIYWLELILGLNWVDEKQLQPILIESSEILAIFTSIGQKLNN
ncbi:MAG: four helix bundle protein [Bacteroidota bacterium]